MKDFKNVELYTTPEGDVMYKPLNEAVKKLEITDRDFIQWYLNRIGERFPKAFQRLSETYSKHERNRLFYEFKMASRFARCNHGEYDQHLFDIDKTGCFQLEQVKCPMRGECLDEGIICCPEENNILSDREIEIFRLISEGYETNDIASQLFISPFTVNRHRENIKSKIGVHSVAQMILYWNSHNLK